MTMYDNDGRRTTTTRNEGMGWGIPALIVAAIIIIGGLFYMNSNGSGTSTASNNTPKTATTTNSGPTAPGAPAPGPTTTTPAPNR
jgi:hypothetical protein